MSEFNFYLSHPHACGYLDDEQATTLFIDPCAKLSAANYQNMMDVGFRRSGNLLYRPHCSTCQACIPVRVDIKQFKLSRSQRRTLKRNTDLTVRKNENGFQQQHFDLYSRYLAVRHPEGGMDPKCTDTYHALLGENWTHTTLYEFYLEQDMIAVAITDKLLQGLSAVYTFFDPLLAERSLGTFAILKQIEMCQSFKLDWLYLGFWNPLSGKMEYKNRFSPLQYFYQSRWHTVPPDIAMLKQSPAEKAVC